MNRILLALAFSAGFSAQAFAQSDEMSGDMSCEEFAAMDSESQMEAIQTLSDTGVGLGAGSQDPQAGERTTVEELLEQTSSACEEDPTMTVGDAMESAHEN